MNRALATVSAAAVLAVAVLAAQPARRAISLVVVGGTVVTQNAAHDIVSPGAIAIDGTDIVEIGAPAAIASRYQAAETIEARDDIILPGLINTHTHAPMVMYRGLADDLALMDWLQKYIFPAEAKTVSPELVRIGTRLAALEMIESGTTTFADMYYFEEEIAKASIEAGLRGILGQTIIQFPVADAKTPADGLARAERFIQEFKDNGLVVPAVAPHALYTNDRTTLVASAELGRKYGVPVIIHFAESDEEVKLAREKFNSTPAAYLESIGFWGPNTLAAHAIWVNDDDIAILKRRDIGLAHNPESNMKLASRRRTGHEVSRRRRRARTRHRRRRQQQRPRHVRGDAAGILSREARHQGSDGGAGAGRAGHGHHRRRPRAAHGAAHRLARPRASAPTSSPSRCARRGRRRCTIRSRTWSTPPAATTCARRS